MNKKETEGESSNSDISEVEKLLEEFFFNSNKQFAAFGEDLIKFSDESEVNISDSEEYTTDEENDNTNDSVRQDFASTSQKLKTQLTKILEDKSGSCTEISEFRSVPLTSEFFTCQKSSRPFKIKDEKGSLVCSLCNWMSPENSCETFLAHCKTPAHRIKLKERFPLEQNQENIPGTAVFRNKKTQETCSKPETFPEKHFACSQELLLKKQNGNQTNQKSQKKEQKQFQSQQQPQAINKKKSSKSKKKAKSDEKQTQENVKLKENKINALKTSALAKSMAYIQPLSEQELICKMCSKIIPKALDTSTSIKNVSHHMQSKGHLKKVLEIEYSLRKTLEKSDEKKKNENNKKKNSNEKNAENAPKAETFKGDLSKNAAPSSKKQTIFNQKKVPKPKNPAPETIRSDLQKEKTDKEKLSSNTMDLKTGYLCLACNSHFQNCEVFKTHMNSKTHFNCLNNKKTKFVSAPDNLQKCNGCKLWLTGSLYDVNKHYAECLERKN